MFILVDDSNFAEVVKQAEVPVFVYFDGAHQVIDMTDLTRMSVEYASRPPFLLICRCLGNGANTIREARITSRPAALIYYKGRIVARSVRHIHDLMEPGVLRAWLDKVLTRLANK